MKYKYQVLRVEKVSELEKYLNHYAEAGWRLVETKWQRPDGVVFIMEREEECYTNAPASTLSRTVGTVERSG